MTSSNLISFQQDGSPFSTQFDDIYFDTESGCLQSEQVFLNGNNIAEQLVNKTQPITIAETGFGTGLNFLLTLKLYQSLSAEKVLPKLTFITTEKFPLTKGQLAKSLACLPHLKDFSDLLLARYPDEVTQDTTLSFANNKITLKILLGDATASFAKLKTGIKGLIDAWYLDGFSPSKNPDMWQDELFEQMARLSKADATVATFTVAGLVRRGLTNNGFRVQRQAYGGKKKEILTGKFQQSPKFGKGYQIRPVKTKPQHVTIVGGGIASACLALALVKKDIKVTLYCKDEVVADGASSNKIGALYPLIHQTKDDISLFYQQAFTYARDYYDQLLEQGFHFDHAWCGLLELSFNDKLLKREQGMAKNNCWPKALIQSVDAAQASDVANIELHSSALYLEKAGWIAPQQLVHAVLKAAESTKLLKVKTKVNVTRVSQQSDGKWQLTTNKGELKASNLVIAGGAEAINIAPINQLPMYPVRGQVSTMNTNAKIRPLSTVICHKGYLTPANDNSHCIGATFDKGRTDTESDNKSDQYNLTMLKESMNEDFGWNSDDIIDSKARLRCVTPDHLPIAGPMAKVNAHPALYSHLAKDKNWRYHEPAPHYNNLYLLTGLGARGLCSAPLLADIVTADICGTPYPVNTQMLFNLSSNRFVIRDLIKRKLSVD